MPSSSISLLFTLSVWAASLFCAPVLLAKNLVIGVEDIAYYPYFDFTASNNSFSKMVFDKFASDSGHSVTYVPLPIKQFSKWLHKSNVDFKFPDSRRWQDSSPSDSHATHFSESVLYMRAGTIVLEINQDKPSTFFKSLGMIDGYYPNLWLEKIARNEVNLLRDTSAKVLVKQLVNEIVDGIDIDLGVAQYYMKELQIDQPITYSSQLKQNVFSYQLSTLKYPEIIEQFNHWLAANQHFLSKIKTQLRIPDILPE